MKQFENMMHMGLPKSIQSHAFSAFFYTVVDWVPRLYGTCTEQSTLGISNIPGLMQLLKTLRLSIFEKIIEKLGENRRKLP